MIKMKINKDKIANSLVGIMLIAISLQGAFHELNEWQFWVGFVGFFCANALFFANLFDKKGDIIIGGEIGTFGFIVWLVIFCAFWVRLFLGDLSW